MLGKAFLLFALFVLLVQGKSSYSEIDDPFASSGWSFRTLPDLDAAETKKETIAGREIEEATEKDREPLGPDYRDPTRKHEEKPTVQPPIARKPTHPSYDPSIIPGGVLEVDVGDPKYPTFPQTFPGFPNPFPSGFPDFPDTFGLQSPFGGRTPGGLFGLGGFFGNTAELKPWWKGENVCVEREESTDDEDVDAKSADKNDTELEKVPNFFSTSISLSNCHQNPTKYECTTKINNHGVVKTLVVRYKCCYGFKRSDDSPGCTKKLELKPLLDTIEEVGASEFRQLAVSTGKEDTFKHANITVFAPTNDALTQFTENMVDLNNVGAVRRRRQEQNAISSSDLLANHIVPGLFELADFDNDQILQSENKNNPIRINIYPTRDYGKMVTANCIRFKRGDNFAQNGIVHLIEGVISPVEQSVLDIVADHPQLRNFKQVLDNTNLATKFKSDGHYTIFAPTDEAFNKLDETTKQKILKGNACADSILKHHIVAHTVCSAAILGNATTHNVEGDLLNLRRTEDDVLLFENDARIVKGDIMGTNGVIHLIDTIIVPESALFISQALKSENITKFEKLIEDAGLLDEIDSLKNATVFAPSDEALEDPRSKKILEEIGGDKDKLRELIMYHTIQGQLPSCDMNNNQMLKSNIQDQPLRLNLYSTLPVFTNIINRATINCARVTGYDEKSCGSVIHEVSELLVPPKTSILDIVNESEKYSTLRELIKGTEVEEILKDPKQSLTLLAPTDEAFSLIDKNDLKILKENKEKADGLLKSHILTEVLCCSGVGPQTWGFSNVIPSLSHQHQQVGRTGNTVRIGGASVLDCDKVATNGVVHTVNKVIFPQRPHNAGFGGFFLFDL